MSFICSTKITSPTLNLILSNQRLSVVVNLIKKFLLFSSIAFKLLFSTTFRITGNQLFGKGF